MKTPDMSDGPSSEGSRWTQALAGALDDARDRARERRQVFCSCEQALEVLLIRAGSGDAALPVSDHLDDQPPLGFEPTGVELSRKLRGVLEGARATAARAGSSEVTEAQALAALLGSASPISKEMKTAVRARLERPAQPAGSAGEIRKTGEKRTFLKPLEPRAEDAFLVERPALLDRVLLTLMYGNPLLVGPPGSGRRSLVRLLVRALHEGRLPKGLAGLRLLELDPTQLIAGTTYRGELEERVQAILTELTRSPEPSVLVVEDLHLLAGAGGAESGIETASALVPQLKSGAFKMLGCTTHELLRERLEKHQGLLHCLTPVDVPPPEPAEARRLLVGFAERHRQALGISIGAGALDRSLELCREHVPHLALPGAAERLVHAAAAELAFETDMLAREPRRAESSYWKAVGGPAPAGSGNGAGVPLGERHVLLALSKRHRIPFEHLDSEAQDKIRGFDTAFREQIFGQDHVLPLLGKIVKVSLMNLADRRFPRGRIFFIGSPGTGKTETAKLLARHVMGRDDAVLRFDMSGYQEASSVSTLLGSDKGLVDSEKGGELTEPVRQDPHRVILFDEIEKAHPSVFNIFLQILGNGEIRDRRGCVVSFRHTLCLFTSNVGCSATSDLAGWSRERIVQRLGEVFRAEFLDRIEAFVPFRALDASARTAIAEAQLAKLRDTMERGHGVTLRWTKDVEGLPAAPPEGEAGGRHVLRWVQLEVAPAVADVLQERGPGAAGISAVRLSVGADGRLVADPEVDAAPPANELRDASALPGVSAGIGEIA